MAGKIVLFGATGFTGRLTAQALVERGIKPVLAGRNLTKLQQLAGNLGTGIDCRMANASDPSSVAALLDKGDVLISTVGPFSIHGESALQAAIQRGAHYVDSTGEPGFIRRVFEQDRPAKASGSILLTAFGYDYVPGHAAGGHALQHAGPLATRVDVGYFWTGSGADGFSQGTLASSQVAALSPGLEWHEGRMQERFGGVGLRDFEVEGKKRSAISVGGSEHYSLPKVYPSVHEVNTYLGWYGKRSAVMSRAARGLALISKVPMVTKVLRDLAEKNVKSDGQGPDAEARAKGKSLIVAEAFDATGRMLKQSALRGANGYDFTAGMLAWAAGQLSATPPELSGALGPVEAFGLDALLEGCESAGLSLRG